MTRLYHFTSAKYALDDIRNKRIKIAQFDDLNDPFELKCVDLSADGREWAFDGFKAQMALRFGVLCFSEQWNSILQWSHYGDRHRGICLGFDVSNFETKFGPVEYRPGKLAFPAMAKFDQAFMWTMLRTKSEWWQYEKEWRVFLELTDGVWNECASRLLYFADFGAELNLREVILGAENRSDECEIHDALREYPQPPRVARVRLSASTFELRTEECRRQT